MNRAKKYLNFEIIYDASSSSNSKNKILTLLSPTIIRGSLALNAKWLGIPSFEATIFCNKIAQNRLQEDF